MHFMGTQDTRVDGDTAEVLTYCTAYHVRTDGRHATVGVRYRDALVRTPGGWRIARRSVRTAWSRDLIRVAKRLLPPRGRFAPCSDGRRAEERPEPLLALPCFSDRRPWS
jgi:hypothetical protein